MSSTKTKRHRKLDFLDIQNNATELYDTMIEYLILKEKYEEPMDAKRLRIQAEETMKVNDQNYDQAYNYFSTAMKLMKAYYNL